MSQPSTVTIASDLRLRLRPILLDSGRFRSTDDFEVCRLLRDCDQLQKADAALASLVRAEIYQVLGAVDEIEKWADNAYKLGLVNDSLALRAIAYSNLGFFSKSSALFAEVVKVSRGQVNQHLALGLTCGSFVDMQEAAQAWVAAGGTINCEDKVMYASSISAVMKRLEVSEATLRELMDEAGHVMRTRRLLWLNECPDYLISEQNEAPFLAVQYQVKVQPYEAAQMTWELAEALAERGVMPPSLTVSFVGVEPRIARERK